VDTDLINVLNKGPSFVNTEPKELSKLCLLAKANLQLVTDKLNQEDVPENAINEFKGGIARIISECIQSGPNILKHKKLHYKPRPDNIVITPSDKSKRLIALDSTCYHDMVDKSTISKPVIIQC
jgi:hypothetical protein